MKVHDLIMKIDDATDDLWFDHLEGWSTVGTPPWPGEGPKGPIQYIAYTNAREGDDDPFEGIGWTPSEALRNLLTVLTKLQNEK